MPKISISTPLGIVIAPVHIPKPLSLLYTEQDRIWLLTDQQHILIGRWLSSTEYKVRNLFRPVAALSSEGFIVGTLT